MQVLYRYCWASGVIKSVHGLHAEHEGHRAIEDAQEDEGRDQAHERDVCQVALAIVGRRKDRVVLPVIGDFGVHLNLQSIRSVWKGPMSN